MDSIVYYGQEVGQKKELPKPLTDYEDDPLQMAGNIIIDGRGKVVHVHSSRYPADRPTIDEIVTVLKKNLQLQ